VQRLFAALAAQHTACFRYGVTRGTPTLSPRDYTATGIMDLAGDRVRMVTVGLPAEFIGSLSAVRPRNPLRRLAFAGFRAFFNRLAVTREERYEGRNASIRDAPGGAWTELPGGAEDGRPFVNNPAWIVALLKAPAAAVHTRVEESLADDELHLDIALDLTLIEAELPAPVARDLRGRERDRLTRMPMQICSSAEGIPTRLAISMGTYSDTGEDGWSVLEFTSYGTPFEEPDLWSEWRSIAPESPASS
jgi:hypothetical protein